MRDNSAFLEWAVRNKFFVGFNFLRPGQAHLKQAVITVFFAGNTNDYHDFNQKITAIKQRESAQKKIESLRLILTSPSAATVKAAFFVNPWQKTILSAQSLVFEAALASLTAQQRQTFTTWMEGNYKRFRNSVSAPRFAMSLSTAVCPYCDKAFLDVGKQFYGELDHYLDKATHSYYALNLYNFVPVCGVCNRKKSKTKLNHFHPAHDTLDSVFKFYLSAQDKQDVLLNYHPVNVKICQRSLAGKEKHLKELNKTFALDDRYEGMAAVVDYLAQLKRIYTPEWMKELQNTYGITYTGEQLRQLLLGQLHVRNPTIRLQPLTKLIDDLVKELDVFNDASSTAARQRPLRSSGA